MKDRTVLVIGAAGFIGSHFVDLLVAKSCRVIVLDALTYAGKKENLSHALASGKVEFVQGNLCDGALLSELLQKHTPNWVVNFAAESHVDRSIEDSSPFITTNIVGTFTLLQAVRGYHEKLTDSQKTDFRLLQVSTDEVFGSLGSNGYFTEASTLKPNSPYSASKASADHLVRAWHHTYGLPTLTTHCSNNYGPRQFPEKLIPHMIACALAGKPLPVYGKGENIRDWIHVEDHCAGILLALEKARVGSVYCFGGRAEWRNIDLIRLVCDKLDQMKPKKDGSSYEEQISFVTDRLGHDFRYAIDDTKAEKVIGFKRKFTFESGLTQTIQWYLENEQERLGLK